MNPKGLDALMLQTRLRERDGADKAESLQYSDSHEYEKSRNESDINDENDIDSINTGAEDDSTNDVILAFIDDKKEVERPATKRSGRSITRRSENEPLYFLKKCLSKWTTYFWNQQNWPLHLLNELSSALH